MLILRKYQLDIIFLFFAILMLIWLGFYLLKNWGINPHEYEWYIAGPLIVFYLFHLWKIRSSISLTDRRAHTTKSMIYWIALGVMLFMSYSTPIEARDYWSINVLFVLFTLLLADSYWDFKKISWRSIVDKKELNK
ncbi:MAG TPA: hypothetical protein VJB62_04095 [Patescibacteria group bacterium]|nr:hypothetical protein [Patescibacteria group bacterium]